MKNNKALLVSAALLLLAVALLASFSVVSAQGQKVVLYFFWGDGCPHCAEAKPFLAQLEQRYPALEIRAFEVWYDDDNLDLWKKMASAKNFEPRGVPSFFIGDRYFEGYSDSIGEQLEDAIKLCLANSCPDAGAGIVPEGLGSPLPTPEGGVQPTPQPTAEPENTNPNVIKVPFFGNVDLTGESVWISTLLIAFVDGFNPCSMWVLSILLALTLRTGSRKKIVLIGLIFIFVTASIYALFIAGLFTVLMYVRFLGWIQVVVALVALFFGLVNIKDYFFYKEGLSFTIDDKHKPGIFAKIRKVMDASDNVWSLAGATVVLAAGVSLIEFACTAGFPVLWTNLLSAQQVTPLLFGILLLVYMLVYQLDELGLFFVAVFTLKASKLQESQGRILKLIGGTLMLTLSVVMVVNPALMNNLNSSMIIFLVAFGAAGLVLLVHRVILPRFGIWIGSEENPKGKKSHKKKTR
ncbi:MAG: thioredoxin family protein [Anaerolineae bacterium]|nr:thioredoxin family protein [Anaerolineae bacterium]